MHVYAITRHCQDRTCGEAETWPVLPEDDTFAMLRIGRAADTCPTCLGRGVMYEPRWTDPLGGANHVAWSRP